MAITTLGGSGTGPLTVTANSTEVKTVFTTPATSNAIFLVEVWLYGGGGFVSYAPAGFATGSFPAAVHKESPASPKCVFRGVYGPSVPVQVVIENADNAAATVNFAFSYISLVVT